MGFTRAGVSKIWPMFCGNVSNSYNKLWNLGFSSTEPNAIDGTGVTEPNSEETGYHRVSLSMISVPNSFKLTTTDGGRSITTNQTVFMPEPINNWTPNAGEMSNYFCMYTGSVLDFYGELRDATTNNVGVNVTTGHIFFIREGDFKITIDPEPVVANVGE